MRIKKILFGTNDKNGILNKILIYFFLILFGFVFLYPLFYMITYSLMEPNDLVNPLIKWLPSKLYFGNYLQAMKVVNFWPVLLQTIFVSLIPALVQTISTAIIGYGFARFNFFGKSVLFAIVLATFVIPPQVTIIPQFLMFKELKLIGSIMAYILPALFGQGIKSGLFILIFYQFFRSIPKSLEEAAEIDGANTFKIFLKVILPLTGPALIISFLFSFVWYWNETTLAAIYFGDKLTTLPLQLQNFAVTYQKLYLTGGNLETGKSINEAINMAGTMLIILPLLIVYFVTQRWFVESIERSGITGE